MLTLKFHIAQLGVNIIKNSHSAADCIDWFPIKSHW